MRSKEEELGRGPLFFYRKVPTEGDQSGLATRLFCLHAGLLQLVVDDGGVGLEGQSAADHLAIDE